MSVPRMRGSSPLTRGKPWKRYAFMISVRLIPAHAGKTAMAWIRADGKPAHPRSRGENVQGRSVDWVQRGSSPLTRGKPSPMRRSATRPWLIPAHTGKTRSRSATPWGSPAHPRSRGENRTTAPRGQIWRGSSPLTRGKRVGLGAALPVPRLIPAHAGKTVSVPNLSLKGTAHPRSRGENRVGVPEAHVYRGSSPLTRGKRQNRTRARTRTRLIPAHAGKTLTVMILTTC